MAESPSPSIHHQRRWFYALWSVLLLAGIGANWMWVTPARVERPRFGLVLHGGALPPDVQVHVWIGPRVQWSPRTKDGSGGFMPLARNGAGDLVMGAAEVPIAVRRWVNRTLIPSLSHDLVVLRYTVPAGGSRYQFMSMREDWYAGNLRDGKRLYYSFSPKWDALRSDSGLPEEFR